jgi:hypothetical protein
MKTMLAVVLVAIAGCSHNTASPAAPADQTSQPADPPAPPATTVASADPYDTLVDPTLPSWAPKTCRAYHATVMRVLGCLAIDETRRASIRAQYDVDHARWDTMHDEPLDAISKVGVQCKASLDAVQGEYDAKCVTARN